MKILSSTIPLAHTLLLFFSLTSCVPPEVNTMDEISDNQSIKSQVAVDETETPSDKTQEKPNQGATGDEGITNQQSVISEDSPMPTPATIRTSKDSKDDVQLLGEQTGSRHKWQELKEKLQKELNEKERQASELKVKIQIIDQIANRLVLKTKAFSGSDSKLIIDISIENPTDYTIKDVAISCDQLAPTGTKIKSHTETIYEIIGPGTTRIFPGNTIGKIHKHTKALNCEITNFSVHN